MAYAVISADGKEGHALARQNMPYMLNILPSSNAFSRSQSR